MKTATKPRNTPLAFTTVMKPATLENKISMHHQRKNCSSENHTTKRETEEGKMLWRFPQLRESIKPILTVPLEGKPATIGRQKNPK